MKTTKQEVIKQTITGDMVEDAWSEIEKQLNTVEERLNNQLPYRVFQERHTTGWLWWKKTYYKYYRYIEGSMVAVPIYSGSLIKELEAK